MLMKSSSEKHTRVFASLSVAALCAAGLVVTTSGSSWSTSPGPEPWRTEFTAAKTVDVREDTGLVGFVGSAAGRSLSAAPTAGTTPQDAAKEYLTTHAASFGLAGKDSSLRVASKVSAPGDGNSVRVQQYIDGLPVLAGQFAVTLDARERVTSVLGEATPAKQVDRTQQVTAAQARETALQAVRKDTGAADLVASAPTLQVYDARLLGAPPIPGGPGLAWVSEVGDGHSIGKLVVVDARRRVAVLAIDTVHAARNRTVCDANNTSGQVPCTAPVRSEANPPQPGDDTDVQLAFEYTGDTYDFFHDRFGWDSLDGQGMQLKTTVDYCDPQDACPYENAFWDGEQMVYGDGFASADDVVGHELAHGFTDHTSHLFYYSQSGAINESLSDVFGELLDQSNSAGDDSVAAKWQMGEDLPIGELRDMSDPTLFGDPDRMLSPDYMSGFSDSEGVHYNSGVNNKATFLMTDGGSFNGQSVTGLGLTKVARLYFTVNSTKLVSGSDYADLANALRQSCAELAGTGTDAITTSDCAEVNKAILATEMDQNPSGAATKDAELCPSGQSALSTAYANDLETNSGQLTPMAITGSHWYYPQNTHSYQGWDPSWSSSGTKNAWGDNVGVISDSALRMTNAVTVPPGGQLHFQHAFAFESDSPDYYDGGVLEYSTSGPGGTWHDAGSRLSGLTYTGTLDTGYNNPLGGRSAFGGSSRGYGSTRANLSDLAGQQVMFRWRIGTDSSQDSYGWFIDDITITSCGTGTPQPSPTVPPTVPPTNPPTVPQPPATDTTAPQTTIKKGPKKVTSSRKAKFKFSASEAATFQCKLDKGKWKSCKATLKLKKVKPGKHVLQVRATDAAGNQDSSPAKWKWRVRR